MIVEVLTYLGADLVPEGRNRQMRCVNPDHDDRVKSASVSTDEDVYNCFGCGWAGNGITLLQQAKGLSFKDAKSLAESLAGGSDSALREGAARESGSYLPGKSRPGRRRPYVPPGFLRRSDRGA